MAAMKKIVAIGPSDELSFLTSVGVECVPLQPDGDLESELRRQAAAPSVGLIIVSESVAQGRHGVIAQVRRDGKAVVLVVPSHRGSTDATLAFMKHVLEQSIGVDLISKS
jgi:vacuolar-type H+-ATPase subunit F/Vma7